MAKRSSEAHEDMAKRARVAPAVPLPPGCASEETALDDTGSAPAPMAIAPEPLPPHLNLDELLAARKSEILALHRAMAQAREATNTRAWQLLPRHMRRRAASHNLLRLPRRLRTKARAELRASNTAPKTRAAMRRRAPERTRRAYNRRRAALTARASRQGRRWLETHLWHAKRFRMSGEKGTSDGGAGRYGFCLAETPHHKSYRASWRAASSYVALHDASYTSVFRVRASARRTTDATARLQLFLALSGAAHGWEAAWTNGACRCDTALLARPRGALATPLVPLQVLWMPSGRECLLFVHPAGARDVQRALTHASDALASRRARRARCVVPQRWEHHVTIEAEALAMAPPPAVAAGVAPSESQAAAYRRAEGFNLFELLGTHTERLLGGVLRPVLPPHATRDDHARIDAFRRILADAPSCCLPRGFALALDVQDPRASFPPHNASATHEQKTEPLPPATYAGDQLFRHRRYPRLTKGQMDSARARGDTLTPERVPVLLIQRVVDPSPGATQLSGFSLLVPRGWGVAFWLSLVHTGARVLGQEQVHQQALNLGRLSYPHDWVASAAFAEAEEATAAARAAAWERRPPAKRVNYEAVGTIHPFGGMRRWREYGETARALQATWHAGAHVKEKDSDTLAMAPCLSKHSAARLNEVLATCEDGPAAARSLWARRLYHDGIGAPRRTPMLTLFVPVLLTACRRGAFDVPATLHMLATLDDVRTWHAALDPPTSQRDAARKRLADLERVPVAASSAVGSVTTGDYALALGRGRALASISVYAWLELERREPLLAPPPRVWGLRKRNPVPLSHLILVRDVAGGPVRAASAARVLT